ncbi:MAG: ABC transporter permease [Verrucomicrobiales bacterium]
MSDAPSASTAPRSPWREAWRRLRRNHVAVACGALLIVIVLACLIGPSLTGHDPDVQNLELGPQPPSATHRLGTDPLGRDLLTRILVGGRVSLAVGLTATLVSLIIGVAYGATSGFLGGRTDTIMMRLVEILYALPFIILVIILIVVLEPVFKDPRLAWLVSLFGGEGQVKLVVLFMVIGAIEWLTMARVVRAQVMTLRQQDFISAALALGVPKWKIIFRHLVPNCLGPIIVYSTLTIPAVMLLEAVLSFLGLGVQAPFASWGSLIQEGADNLETRPWMLVFPSLFFSTTLFCLNFLGDGLRDALDPKAER